MFTTRNVISTKLRKENNEIQSRIEEQLDDINGSLREMIRIMKGE